MKLLILFLSFFTVDAAAQNKVLVQVSNVENNKGMCLICLYDNARAFSGKGEPVRTIRLAPQNGKVTAVFEGVPEGTYAILVVHDANSNNKFDTNFLGIPNEGYGASNNKLPFAAAPRFTDNKFTVSANSITTSNIRLRYIF